MLIELLALGYAVYYTQKLPTWSSTLDATAMARIGASMKASELLPLQPRDEQVTKQMAEADGLVGLLEHEPDKLEAVRSDDAQEPPEYALDAPDVESASTAMTLKLGAPGLITRKLATKIVKRNEEYREVPSRL